MKDRISRLQEQGLTHSLKKASSSGKKRKKNGESKVDNAVEKPLDSLKSDEKSDPNGAIRNVGTASLTARALSEEQVRAKSRKTASNDNVKSLFSTSDREPQKHADFMTRGFSIPAGAKR